MAALTALGSREGRLVKRISPRLGIKAASLHAEPCNRAMGLKSPPDRFSGVLIMALSADIKSKLESVTTATLTTVLTQEGHRNADLKGPLPLKTAKESASSAKPSRCASCRCARISRPGKAGPRRAPHGAR